MNNTTKVKLIWLAGLISILLILIVAFNSGCSLLTQKVPKIISTPNIAGNTLTTVVKSDWIVTFCLLAFFSGVVTIAMGVKKIGISILFASVLTLFLGLAVHRFPTWMAVVGFVGSAGICLTAVLTRKKALVEIIEGVQHYRNFHIGHREKSEIDNYLNKAQKSNSTRKIVKSIKKTISK